jgi:hypothetical protein
VRMGCRETMKRRGEFLDFCDWNEETGAGKRLEFVSVNRNVTPGES